MSYTAAILPILAALNVAQDALHIEKWVDTNPTQTVLMDQYYSKTHELKNLLPQELSSCASSDFDEVNNFLKSKGFDIQLDTSKGKTGDLAVASILDIALKWKVPGEKSWIMFSRDISGRKPSPKGNGILPGGCIVLDEYPAVSMKSGYTIRKTSDKQYILAVEAENGDIVYMTLADKPLQSFDLLAKIQSLSSKTYKDVTNNYSQILFPMVDIDQKVDISWLIGLSDSSGNWSILDALQQTRFQMNEKGAAVQSAVAIHVTYRSISTPKPVFEIDKPFYLWIERPGMSMPLFAAYISKVDWKEPSRNV